MQSGAMKLNVKSFTWHALCVQMRSSIHIVSHIFDAFKTKDAMKEISQSLIEIDLALIGFFFFAHSLLAYHNNRS